MVAADPKITARTERLLVRPLTMGDVDDIFLMRRHPEVMKYTSSLPSADLEKSRDWLQNCLDRPDCWNFVVELPASDSEPPSAAPRVIGLVGAVRGAEIGYMYNHDHWGKGYATEALRAFMPLFFDHFSGGEQGYYEYAEAITLSELVTSQSVLLKAGFMLHEKKEDQQARPILVFRMYRPDSNRATS